MPEIEIRNRPEFKSFLRNSAEIGITVVVWGILVYLFFPVLNIILWLFGARQFYVEVIQNVDYKEFLVIVSRMGLIVLTVFIIMRSWVYYNYLRFGKKNRRKTLSPLLVEHLAGFFRITIERLTEIQSKKEVILSADEIIDDVIGWLAGRKNKG